MSIAFVETNAERVLSKSQSSAAVQASFFRANAREIARCAQVMAQAFQADARLYCFGNGANACSAQHLALEFSHPVLGHRRSLPALALPADGALLTAMGNDGDFASSFAQQLRLHGTPQDIALGISTSGAAPNVLQALRAAQARSMLTIGFAGRDGRAFAEFCDFSFVVGIDNAHRIQETYGTLVHVLWDMVHLAFGEDDLL